MVARVAVGEAVGEVVVQGGPMGGCQGTVSGTTAAIPVRQIIKLGVAERVSSHPICLLLSKGKVWGSMRGL